MQLGANVALNPDKDASPLEIATWFRNALPPNGPDVVIDCAGFEPTLQVPPIAVHAHTWAFSMMLSYGAAPAHQHGRR